MNSWTAAVGTSLKSPETANGKSQWYGLFLLHVIPPCLPNFVVSFKWMWFEKFSLGKHKWNSLGILWKVAKLLRVTMISTVSVVHLCFSMIRIFTYTSKTFIVLRKFNWVMFFVTIPNLFWLKALPPHSPKIDGTVQEVCMFLFNVLHVAEVLAFYSSIAQFTLVGIKQNWNSEISSIQVLLKEKGYFAYSKQLSF